MLLTEPSGHSSGWLCKSWTPVVLAPHTLPLALASSSRFFSCTRPLAFSNGSSPLSANPVHFRTPPLIRSHSDLKPSSIHYSWSPAQSGCRLRRLCPYMVKEVFSNSELTCSVFLLVRCSDSGITDACHNREVLADE